MSVVHTADSDQARLHRGPWRIVRDQSLQLLKWMDPMKVGLLTGGGDCPGLNAVIRAVVQQIANDGGACVGILEGWRGMVQNMTMPLTVAETDGIIAQGGSILGSSRTNPYRNPESELALLRENFARLELDALVVIGGDDTLGVAIRLHNDFGLPVVGIPKTIDNDLMVTDFSFGFDTAVNIVMEAGDRLRTTTESHRRIVVVETMGRHSGWIACFAGLAVGADYILVPEVPIDLPHLVSVLSKRRAAGKKYGIVVVAEGAKFPDRAPFTLDEHPDPFGNPRLGGIGHVIAEAIHKQTGIETRTAVLGHLQRGGAPSAYDRILATRLGLAASRLVLQKRFGTMVTLMGGQIVDTPMSENIVATKTLDLTYYDEAAAFFY
jgi:ATP-dependent phosphofructokinase / diphosphate-dependent phosphofructokinase